MIIADEITKELRRLGAHSVSVLPNGGRKHPKIKASFGGSWDFIMTIPRGTIRDRGHLRQNYLTKTRRAVRNLLGQ